MRLNKYIAQAGLASRRKADELISAGNVKVNGSVLRELGYDVTEGDVVEVNGRRIEPQKKKIYIMLNKPRGYITTVRDEQGRPTVMELVADVDGRVFPVGRLDGDTSGLLLMTNDGDLAHRLTHPRHEVWKTYRARVNGHLSQERIFRLCKGVDIGGFVTAPAKVKVLRQMERTALVEIKIREGKNRQIRKMFDAVGNRVIDLERIAVGEVLLGHLMEGHYRKLSQKEIDYLKNC
ncbi:MAG: pseudouridine synthase [Anaerovoracaceae bacterium]|nr:rRNA pseudouridine synthase [Bacillota bacterium]MDY3955148.1 pseudouridine synthase [Anaerovoracaceae bacterium]